MTGVGLTAEPRLGYSFEHPIEIVVKLKRREGQKGRERERGGEGERIQD